MHGAEEVGKAVIEIGDKFENLNRQVATFTDAQGAGLRQLQTDATAVFSKLDVDSKNLGETLGVLEQRFQLNDDQVKQLTYDFTELTSRMGNLDVREFSSARS